jgi:hypothetical protein
MCVESTSNSTHSVRSILYPISSLVSSWDSMEGGQDGIRLPHKYPVEVVTELKGTVVFLVITSGQSEAKVNGMNTGSSSVPHTVC